MTLEVRPLSPALGAEIAGVDPAGAIDDATVAEVRRAWLEHSIVLFRGVSFTPQSQVAFTRRLGDLHVMTPLSLNHPEHREIFVVSNRVVDGKPVGLARAGRGWHSDGEDKLRPNAGSFLYAIEVPPEGGDTLFASMYRAYDALPADVRTRIEGRRARFSRADLHLVNYPDLAPLTEAERRARPDVFHPIVREHPETGRRALYLGRWAADIEGLDPDEGRDLVRWLQAFAARPEFVYRHRWRAGDAILWDNRCAQHCALPYDDARHVRHMHRTTLEGDVPRLGDVRSEVVPAPARAAAR